MIQRKSLQKILKMVVLKCGTGLGDISFALFIKARYAFRLAIEEKLQLTSQN